MAGALCSQLPVINEFLLICFQQSCSAAHKGYATPRISQMRSGSSFPFLKVQRKNVPKNKINYIPTHVFDNLTQC